jgi:hypothetical protein
MRRRTTCGGGYYRDSRNDVVVKEMELTNESKGLKTSVCAQEVVLRKKTKKLSIQSSGL